MELASGTNLTGETDVDAPLPQQQELKCPPPNFFSDELPAVITTAPPAQDGIVTTVQPEHRPMMGQRTSARFLFPSCMLFWTSSVCPPASNNTQRCGIVCGFPFRLVFCLPCCVFSACNGCLNSSNGTNDKLYCCEEFCCCFYGSNTQKTSNSSSNNTTATIGNSSDSTAICCSNCCDTKTNTSCFCLRDCCGGELFSCINGCFSGFGERCHTSIDCCHDKFKCDCCPENCACFNDCLSPIFDQCHRFFDCCFDCSKLEGLCDLGKCNEFIPNCDSCQECCIGCGDCNFLACDSGNFNCGDCNCGDCDCGDCGSLDCGGC